MLASLAQQVTVIHGVDNSTASIPVQGDKAVAIGVNTSTNLIYVAEQNSQSVDIINGAADTLSTSIALGSTPLAIAVDQATNEVFITTGSVLEVISGQMLMTRVSLPAYYSEIALNLT